jgi:hypothetical protein
LEPLPPNAGAIPDRAPGMGYGSNNIHKSLTVMVGLADGRFLL